MKTKEFVIGTLLGTVVGAVAAILLTPKTGSEVRAKLSFQVENLSEKTQKLAHDVTDKTQRIANEVSDITLEIAKTMSAHTNQFAEKANGLASTVVNGVKSWREERQQSPESKQNLTNIKTEKLS
ncbi:MAG: YtxH domain-containing protein [Paenibacillaceae bacterium]